MSAARYYQAPNGLIDDWRRSPPSRCWYVGCDLVASGLDLVAGSAPPHRKRHEHTEGDREQQAQA